MLARFFVVLLLGVNVLLGYQLLVGPGSILEYQDKKAAYQELQEKNRELVGKNQELSREIKYLRSNQDYIRLLNPAPHGGIRQNGHSDSGCQQFFCVVPTFERRTGFQLKDLM